MSDTNDTRPIHDPVPVGVRRVLGIFEDELSQMRFADIDAVLLNDLAEKTRERSQALDIARQAVESAHQALDEARTELIAHAEQGLAYAKIYGAEDAALSSQLEEIASLMNKEQRSKKPRRKRKMSEKKDAQSATKPEPVAQLPFAKTGS